MVILTITQTRMRKTAHCACAHFRVVSLRSYLRVGNRDFPFWRGVWPLQLIVAFFNDISLSISCWFSIRFVLIAFTDTNFQEVKGSNAFLPIEKVSQCKRRMFGLCLYCVYVFVRGPIHMCLCLCLCICVCKCVWGSMSDCVWFCVSVCSFSIVHVYFRLRVAFSTSGQ